MIWGRFGGEPTHVPQMKTKTTRNITDLMIVAKQHNMLPQSLQKVLKLCEWSGPRSKINQTGFCSRYTVYTQIGYTNYVKVNNFYVRYSNFLRFQIYVTSFH